MEKEIKKNPTCLAYGSVPFNNMSPMNGPTFSAAANRGNRRKKISGKKIETQKMDRFKL